MSDTELPEFIDREVLKDISDVEVPDEALLRCFLKANKPFLSTSAVADLTDLSNEAARNRLNSLVERGVLLSEVVGKKMEIYWLNDLQSSWPVPQDINPTPTAKTDQWKGNIAKINKMSTFTTFFGGIIAGMYLLNWLSSLRITDGILTANMDPSVMPAMALALLGVMFYIALQSSLIVENDGAGWPTIRRVYRRVSK